MSLGLFALIGTAIEAGWGGFYSNRSDAYLCKILEKIRDRIPPTTEPPNHLLQRALRKSYLEATLLLCNSRLKEIEPRAWKRCSDKILKPDITNRSSLSLWAEKIGEQLLPADETERDELLWLINVREVFAQERNRVDATEHPLEISREYELFMQPSGESVRRRVDEMRKQMKTELLAELERVGSSMAKSGLDINSSTPVPPNIKEMVESGWIPYEPEETPLPLSDYKKIDWFDCFCGFFQDKLIGKTGDIFQNRLLTNLIIGEGVSREHQGGEHQENPFTFEMFKSELQRLGDRIFARFDQLDLKLDQVDIRLQNLTTLLLQALEIQNSHQSNLPKLPNTILPSSGFVGREDYLRELQVAYQSGIRRFVLHGTGGVGKTGLALKFIEKIKGEFQALIRVDMQGLRENPLSPTDAMMLVVRRFEPNVPTNLKVEDIPDLFVSYLNQYKTLLLLDNVKDREQVEELNQGAAFVVMTSRTVFSFSGGLSKAIKQMSPEDAKKLLFSITDEKRFDGQSDKLAELAGYLPITLKILAALLVEAALLAENKPEIAANLLERYRNKKDLLRVRVPDYKLTVEASFELSYAALTDVLKERWRWLSVFQKDFAENSVEDFLDISEEEARETLKQLCKFSLLETNPETRRFRFHDLAREFADSKFDEFSNRSFIQRFRFSMLPKVFPRLFPTERFIAQSVYAGYYAFILERASDLKVSNREDGFINALKLIDTEWENIKAGQKWAAEVSELAPYLTELCCKYASTISELLNLRLTPQEAIIWQTAALNAARKLYDKKRESIHLNNLGIIYRELGEYDKSIKHHTESLEIARQIRDKRSQLDCLGNLSSAYASRGDYKEALENAEQALEIARQIKSRRSEASALTTLGAIYHDLGNIRKAIKVQKESLTIACEIGNIRGESIALHNLSQSYYELGETDKALECRNQSLQISRQIGDKHGENIASRSVKSSYSTFEEYRSEIQKLEAALELARQSESAQDEYKILHNLSILCSGVEDYSNAIEYLKRAMEIAIRIGDKSGVLDCLGTLGNMYGSVGQDRIAIEICEQALQLAREIGDRLSEGINLQRLGLGYAGLGDMEKACAFWQESLSILNEIGSPRATEVQQLLINNCK